MTQASTCPPTFVCFCNDARLFHFSYQRYLENQIREVFGLTGTPVRMVVRERGDKALPEKMNSGGNMTLTHFAIIAVCAYLLGSLSFAIIVSKLTLGKDIRNYGSGNAGLTNAYRTMGAKKDAVSFCSVTLPKVPQRFRSAGRSPVRLAS